MDLKTITGPDMRSALRMVREQLGPDAIILSNRRTPAGVEIVAGPEQAWAPPAPSAPAVAPAAPRTPVLPAAHTGVPVRPAAPPVPVAGGGMHALQSELRDLRALLEQRFEEMHVERLGWGPGNEARAWRRLTRLGLPNEMVHRLVGGIDPRADWDGAWAAVQARLAGGLREAGDLAAAGGVLALVGPTGAGKTTTLCKLAVRHVLVHGAEGLVLASLDATRIGGADMLRALARLLDVPFHAALDGESVEELVARIGACRLLLIDTAGLNRRCAAQAQRLASLGALASRLLTLLVIPANAQLAWLGSALEEYRAAAPAAAVITKIDETVSLGEALGALQRAALPVAYVSDGQEIPDDLHVAEAAGLVAQALALDTEDADRRAAPAGGGREARAASRVGMPDNAARIA